MGRIWVVGFLTLIWCSFSNNFTGLNILFGLILSSVCNMLIHLDKLDSTHRLHWGHLFILLGFTVIEAVKASVKVAWDIVTPTHLSKPRVIQVVLDCESDLQIMLLSNLISLAPGTLSIDVTPGNKYLLIHCMFAQDPQEISDFIKQQLEPKVRKALVYVNA
jgi:multicomponent Na+:H+ antiporter subunit E